MARTVVGYDWFLSGPSPVDVEALEWLHDLQQLDDNLVSIVVASRWFEEGGASDFWSRLEVVHQLALTDLEVTVRLMEHPWIIDNGPDGN